MAVATFNLAAPPGFHGLDPYKPISVYALPREKREFLQRLREHWEHIHPEPRSDENWETLARELFRCGDAWLDEGYGDCHFRDPRHAAILEEGLFHFQNERYQLACWVIMPNHCHLVVRPFEDWRLETILQGMKGIVARRMNAELQTTGPPWQDESYDRIIRDEEHLWRVIQYIGRNPAKGGLPPDAWRRWIDPAWQAAGWHFFDNR